MPDEQVKNKIGIRGYDTFEMPSLYLFGETKKYHENSYSRKL
jgi:hypothetical protein